MLTGTKNTTISEQRAIPDNTPLHSKHDFITRPCAEGLVTDHSRPRPVQNHCNDSPKKSHATSGNTNYKLHPPLKTRFYYQAQLSGPGNRFLDHSRPWIGIHSMSITTYSQISIMGVLGGAHPSTTSRLAVAKLQQHAVQGPRVCVSIQWIPRYHLVMIYWIQLQHLYTHKGIIPAIFNSFSFY